MKLVFDCEVYTNYLLIYFRDTASGRTRYIEMHNDSPLDRQRLSSIIGKHTLIGFNSLAYDVPIITAALAGWDNAKIKRLSDHIVTSGERHLQIERRFGLRPPRQLDHIDLIEVAPGMAGLKLYGGRLNAPKLQDLPIAPDAVISKSDAEQLRLYCLNDLDLTARLYDAMKGRVELRETLSEKYGMDLRSKSDAQIAEAIIRQYLEAEGVSVGKRTEPVKPFKYRVPEWVELTTPELKEALELVRGATFTVSPAGKPVMPKELDRAFEFNGARYKFGIGGLHSQEKRQAVVPGDDEYLAEWDVASMYPSIIIEQELYPKHLGPEFLKVYSNIKRDRLTAKRAGDDVTNAVYKIALNGSYGKFGSVFSYLYSPELLIQTTITGQLALLMLIEKMTAAGGRVVSANTDGVNVLIPKSKLPAAREAQFDWELCNGYELEETEYLATYSRDVNSYIALKPCGKVKGKGAYAIGGLMKNPSNVICIEAVITNLADGTPVDETIRQFRDITKFTSIRTVNGGAVKDGVRLGKAIRWYYATGVSGVIHYASNGNKVPKSDGAKPLMDLPEQFPDDVDYDWYIAEATKMLKEVGASD